MTYTDQGMVHTDSKCNKNEPKGDKIIKLKAISLSLRPRIWRKVVFFSLFLQIRDFFRLTSGQHCEEI